MANVAAVPTDSGFDGVDGYVPSGGMLLDAEIVGDGSLTLEADNPNRNSDLYEVSGDNETELADGEVTDEAGDEEGVSEDAPVTEGKKTVDSYWQSQHDKLKAQYDEIAQWKPVLEALRNDPGAQDALRSHWGNTSKAEPQRAPELVEPEEPEDFDAAMINVRGSSSQKYWNDLKVFNREVARRDAVLAAQEAVSQATRPFAEQQAAARKRYELTELLKATDLPPDEYEAFAGWVPKPEDYVRAYMSNKGLRKEVSSTVEAKAKEFSKIRENSGKAAISAKPKGNAVDGPKDAGSQFLESLRSISPRYAS
jgi:hypothetical protein